jgi:hypothetical protein
MPRHIYRWVVPLAAADRATSIDVGPGESGTLPVQLRLYDQAAALPTSLTVPCSGSGLFAFVPAPGGPGSVPAMLKVTFVSAA